MICGYSFQFQQEIEVVFLIFCNFLFRNFPKTGKQSCQRWLWGFYIQSFCRLLDKFLFQFLQQSRKFFNQEKTIKAVQLINPHLFTIFACKVSYIFQIFENTFIITVQVIDPTAQKLILTQDFGRGNFFRLNGFQVFFCQFHFA